MVKFNLGAIPVKQVELRKIPGRPAWYKAKVEDIVSYSEDLDLRITNISVPGSIDCQEINCTNPEHSRDRDHMVLDIVVNMIEACHSNIPIVGSKTVKNVNRNQSQCIPGWKEEVVPYQEDARF